MTDIIDAPTDEPLAQTEEDPEWDAAAAIILDKIYELDVLSGGYQENADPLPAEQPAELPSRPRERKRHLTRWDIANGGRLLLSLATETGEGPIIDHAILRVMLAMDVSCRLAMKLLATLEVRGVIEKIGSPFTFRIYPDDPAAFLMDEEAPEESSSGPDELLSSDWDEEQSA